MTVFPDEKLSAAEQFLDIAKSHFRACAIDRIRAQPWFRSGRVQVRDHIENDVGEMDYVAWWLDYLDPCACARSDLQEMIQRTDGERRAWLEGIFVMRERMHQTGCNPFN